jgi:WD40 repeat protein
MREDAPQRDYSIRELYNGLCHVVKTGCQRRLVPHDLPRLASSSDERTVTIWDTATGQELLSYPGQHVQPISQVASSPDGNRLVTVGHDGTKVWDGRPMEKVP